MEPTSIVSFSTRVQNEGRDPFRRAVPTTLQVNVGKLCNQMCEHCHVEAGPGRKEIMDARTIDRVLELLAASPEVRVLDITGGAPEMNPGFRTLVSSARNLERDVIVRSNLTILVEEGQEELIPFLAEQGVTIIASLPCYTSENVDRQRGDGVFDQSIEALRKLNTAGFGVEGSALELHLVYNPLGPTLPPPQATLEVDYKYRLQEDFGISFNQLFTITNVPVKRFSQMLRSQDKEESYLSLLADSFNPRTIEGLMCRHLVSVDWEGRLFDCDFNQMMDLPLGASPTHRTLWDVDHLVELDQNQIATANHCFACTAGSGSSCGGALEG